MEGSIGHMIPNKLVAEALRGEGYNSDDDHGDLLDSIVAMTLTAEDEVELWKELYSVAMKYTRVRVYMSIHGWTTRLLELLVDARRVVAVQYLAMLCGTMCSFSVGVREVRTLLRLLKDEQSDRRPVWWEALLAIFRKAVSPTTTTTAEPSPLVYWDLSGSNSGIVLPPFAKLPSGGMTVALWLRCESFMHVSVPRGTPYEPCVCCWLDDAGVGWSLRFTENFLMVEVSGGWSRAPSRYKCMFPFRTLQWYCVVVSFEYHFLGRDDCFVYIDGIQRAQFAVSYPKSTGVLSMSCVGARLKRASKTTVDEASLIGQVGAILVMEDELREQGAKQLHALPATSWSVAATILRLFPKAVASYDPRATEGPLCLETLHGERKMHATKLEGTMEIRQSDVCEAVLCSGGPQILLPLLAQLDLPPSNSGVASAAAFQALASSSSAAVSHNLSTVLELLGATLRHPLAERDMLQHHGFAILGHVLRFVSPAVWDETSFAALEILSSCTVQSEKMHRAFFINVYLNFRVWIYAPVAVQRHVMTAVAEHACRQPQYFRAMITVQRLIDSLRQFYWVEPDEWALGRTDIVDATTGHVVGERPKGQELQGLRHALLHVVRTLIVAPAPTLEEISCLMLHIHLAPDVAGEPVDVLQLLLTFLNEPANQMDVTVAQTLMRHFGLGAFVTLTGRQSESLVVWSIKTMGKVLQVVGRVGGGGGASARDDMWSVSAWLVVLKATLQSRRLTRDLYFALLELLFETVDTVAVSNPASAGAKGLTFRHPVVLSIILELLAKEDRDATKSRCLSDILSHLTGGTDLDRTNRITFMAQGGWELLVVKLLVVTQPQSESVALDILSLLLQHCLMEGEWPSVARVHVTLDAMPNSKDRVAALLHGRVAQQLAGAHAEVQSACRRSEKVGAAMCQWLALAEISTTTTEDVQAVATLAESVLLVVLGMGKRDEREWQLCSQTLRLSFAALKSSLRLLVSNNRESSQDCYIVLACIARRLQMIAPLWASRSSPQQKPMTNQLLAHALDLSELKTLLEAQRLSTPATEEAICSSLGCVLAVLRSASPALLPSPSSTSTTTTTGSEDGSSMLAWLRPSGGGGGGILVDAAATSRQADSEAVSQTWQRWRQGLARRAEECSAARSQMWDSEGLLVRDMLNAWEQRWVEMRGKELSRRSALLRATNRKNTLLVAEWNRLLATLAHGRGPWAISHQQQLVQQQRVFWTLDASESDDALWLHRLKRVNNRFDPHTGCAKLTSKVSVAALEEPPMLPQGVAMPTLAAFLVADDLPNHAEGTEQEEEEAAAADKQFSRSPTGSSFSCSLLSCKESPQQGTLEITENEFIFAVTATGGSTAAPRTRVWSMADLMDFRDLRYCHRRVALELGFFGGKTRLLVFPSRDVLASAYQCVVALNPPRLHPIHSAGLMKRRTPPSLVSRLQANRDTEAWLAGRLSNFEYLMILNRAAGRSYNDLAQWPVMPWVLADWTSPTLDLTDPRVYRDFSQPVGALNPGRREALKRRYADLASTRTEDMGAGAGAPPTLPFHHGSHYSTPGSVLFWLIRQEPFTSLHLHLQNGRFDHADRLFTSLATAWEGVWNNPNDCKEMVPELFYDAGVLRNENRFTFGTTQTGLVVDDVVLPPWATSAEHFVALHRAALESDYVTAHLHLWIDLIFGHAQRGKAAIDTLNVYYWLTYAGAIDLDRPMDAEVKASLQSQIENFGQCAGQLFRKAHPARTLQPSLRSDIGVDGGGGVVSGYSMRLTEAPSQAPVAVFSQGSSLVLLYALDGSLYSTLRLVRVPEGRVPFRIENDKISAKTASASGGVARSLVDVNQIAVAPAERAVYSCGYWDNKWRCNVLGEGKELVASNDHLDTITCMGISRRGDILVTGSRDCSLLIWDVGGAAARKRFTSRVRACGHEAPIVCVSVCGELFICASASLDGTIMVWRLHHASLVCTITEARVQRICVAACGTVVTWSVHRMCSWTLQGSLVCAIPWMETIEPVMDLFPDPLDGRFVIVLQQRCVSVWKVHIGLELICKCDSAEAIQAACVTQDGSYIVCAHSGGRISLFPFPTRRE